MEKRIENKINEYIDNFKNEIKNKAIETNLVNDPNFNNLLQYIFDKPNLKLKKEDFMKRKRLKNNINNCDICMANKSNNEKCSRRKKKGMEFCGTHIKGTPYGVSENIPDNIQNIEVKAQDIDGILHYIDGVGNVYKVEDIMQNVHNPKIIYKYKIQNGKYIIESIVDISTCNEKYEENTNNISTEK